MKIGTNIAIVETTILRSIVIAEIVMNGEVIHMIASAVGAVARAPPLTKGQDLEALA